MKQTPFAFIVLGRHQNFQVNKLDTKRSKWEKHFCNHFIYLFFISNWSLSALAEIVWAHPLDVILVASNNKNIHSQTVHYIWEGLFVFVVVVQYAQYF